ncbi:hypothetical protein J2W69_000271 [Rheinheimera soli]|uniref:Uncharacterized protein n=1 Tax=Rheinheimera soli TaxID=443616 RepID=A0ABU1VUF3_9GAMM|nr:hypothetical protein [Rheinheimera soli]
MVDRSFNQFYCLSWYLAPQYSGGGKPRPYNLLILIRISVGATFMVARSF